jgi:hypothetical protein
VILTIAATALAFALARRYKVGILGPLMLPAIVATLAIGIYSHNSLAALIASALMVSLCINLGYFSGVAFYAATRRKNLLAPIADGQNREIATAPPIAFDERQRLGLNFAAQDAALARAVGLRSAPP